MLAPRIVAAANGTFSRTTQGCADARRDRPAAPRTERQRWKALRAERLGARHGPRRGQGDLHPRPRGLPLRDPQRTILVVARGVRLSRTCSSVAGLSTWSRGSAGGRTIGFPTWRMSSARSKRRASCSGICVPPSWFVSVSFRAAIGALDRLDRRGESVYRWELDRRISRTGRDRGNLHPLRRMLMALAAERPPQPVLLARVLTERDRTRPSPRGPTRLRARAA